MERLRKLGLGGWSAVATIAASLVTILVFAYGAVDVLDGDESTSGGNSDPPMESVEDSGGPAETTADSAAAGESVEDFAARAIRTFHEADYAAFWKMFDPAVKRVLPEDQLIRCEEQAGAPATLIGFKFIGAREKSGIEMAGVPNTATAVEFRVTGEIPEGRTTESVVIPVTHDGKTMGVLPTQSEYDAYIAGTCPTPRLETR